MQSSRERVSPKARSGRPGRPRLTSLLLAACACALAGCGAIPQPPSEQPVEFYTLSRADWTAGAGRAARGPVLLVSEPLAAVPYDTPRMAYVRTPQRIEFYGRSEWAGEPTRLLEPILVERLERTGTFSAVVTGANGVLARYRLDTEIYEFQQRFTAGSSEGRVALRAQLLDLDGDLVLAARTFTASAPAPSNDPPGGAAAIAEITDRLVSEIADFAARAATP